MSKLFYIGLVLAGLIYYAGKSYYEFPDEDLSGVYIAQTCPIKGNFYALGNEFPCIFRLDKRKTSTKNIYWLNTYFTSSSDNYIFDPDRDIHGHYLYLLYDNLPEYRFHLSNDKLRTLRNGETIFHHYPLNNSVIDIDKIPSIPSWRYRLEGHWNVVGTNMDYYFSRQYSNAKSTYESEFTSMNNQSRGETPLMRNRYEITEESSRERRIKGTFKILNMNDSILPFEAVFSKDGNEIEITDYTINKQTFKKYTLKRVSDCPRPNSFENEVCKKEYNGQSFV